MGLIEGDHTAEEFARVSEIVLMEVYYACMQTNLQLELTLLKPQMMMAGVDVPINQKPSTDELAKLTLQVLRRRVPPAVPAIFFLSGGQSEIEATINLDYINKLANSNNLERNEERCPWKLSFSFGRSLQGSVLKYWSDHMKENAMIPNLQEIQKSKNLLLALTKVNAEASIGNYNPNSENHPSILSNQSLHETHRGWSHSGIKGGNENSA